MDFKGVLTLSGYACVFCILEVFTLHCKAEKRIAKKGCGNVALTLRQIGRDILWSSQTAKGEALDKMCNFMDYVFWFQVSAKWHRARRKIDHAMILLCKKPVCFMFESNTD